MRLIIGLGNPTDTYRSTRHNVGFMCLDFWAAANKKRFTSGPIFDYLILREVVAIKPKTYMNLSGKALKSALDKWSISETLVVYDDLELEAKQLRIRSGGGDGGHNGMKSLFEVIAPNELRRIRVGIGRSDTLPADEYVLAEFSPSELASYNETFLLVSKFLDAYSRNDFNHVLNEYSRWKKSYSGGNAAGIESPKEERG